MLCRLSFSRVVFSCFGIRDQKTLSRIKTRLADDACCSAVYSAVPDGGAQVPRNECDHRVGFQTGRKSCLEESQVGSTVHLSIACLMVGSLSCSPIWALSSIRSRTLPLQPTVGKHRVIPTIVIAWRTIIAAYYGTAHHRPIHAWSVHL